MTFENYAFQNGYGLMRHPASPIEDQKVYMAHHSSIWVTHHPFNNRWIGA